MSIKTNPSNWDTITRPHVCAMFVFALTLVACGPPLLVVVDCDDDGASGDPGATGDTGGTGEELFDVLEGDGDGDGDGDAVPLDLPDGDGDGDCEWSACIDAAGGCTLVDGDCPEGTEQAPACIEAATGVCAQMDACPDGWVDTCWPDPTPADACACVDPSPGDGDGDPAGDGDGDGDGWGCGCAVPPFDSFCYNPFKCEYFAGGCPEGWEPICNP